jgi:hypothetical protein
VTIDAQPARRAYGVQAFLVRYDDDIVKIAKAARKKMRALFAGSFELVYDNYNALVFAYSSTEKQSDIACSIALYPRWVTLFFARGAALPDPKKILEGSGKVIRGIRLQDASTLDDVDVRSLIALARDGVSTPFATRTTVKTVVRSISPVRRERKSTSTKRTTKARATAR